MNAKDFIKRHEGVSKTLYKDSRGYWTIGVGRLIDPAMNGQLSDDEVDYLLQNDLIRTEAYAKQYAWFDGLSSVRKAAVLDLLFNLGPRHFASFKQFTAAMAANNWQAAHDEILDSDAARMLPKRYNEVATLILSETWPV